MVVVTKEKIAGEGKVILQQLQPGFQDQILRFVVSQPGPGYAWLVGYKCSDGLLLQQDYSFVKAGHTYSVIVLLEVEEELQPFI